MKNFFIKEEIAIVVMITEEVININHLFAISLVLAIQILNVVDII